MSKVWYCPTCGYEVKSRGRCHSCKNKLVASALPELSSGEDDDEVGYRVDDWSDRDRGRLIQRLNHRGIAHRFEDDELVVLAEDEERVDDLVSEMTSVSGVDPDHLDFEPEGEDPTETAVGAGEDSSAGEAPPVGPSGPGSAGTGGGDVAAGDGEADPVDQAIQLLADAAARLEADPTDMQADGDVAEASAGIFLAEEHPLVDDQTWAAIGRVTRSLLAVLGADEALEDRIRTEAAVLKKLLAPIVGGPSAQAGATAGAKERTVYELADWMPEQRAELGVRLEERGIVYEWDGDDLLVPSERETDVEAIFSEVGGFEDDEDGGDFDDEEARYSAIAELFAACRKLSADPSDPVRVGAVRDWLEASQGPPLLGMDEVDWFRIMSKAKALSAALDEGDDLVKIGDEADQLHDLLRSVV